MQYYGSELTFDEYVDVRAHLGADLAAAEYDLSQLRIERRIYLARIGQCKQTQLVVERTMSDAGAVFWLTSMVVKEILRESQLLADDLYNVEQMIDLHMRRVDDIVAKLHDLEDQADY